MLALRPLPRGRPAAPGGVDLRLSLTDRCNFRCRYCRPDATARSSGAPLGAEELARVVEGIDLAAAVRKVRLTGGEPLLRPEAVEIVGHLRRRLPRAELCLTTNGSRLAPLARPLREAGLDRVNISLDAADRASFERVAGVDALERVVGAIDAAREAGLEPLKLNAVLTRSGVGDGLEGLVRLAARKGCELRFIELMPFGAAAAIFEREFLSAREADERLAATLDRVRGLDPSPTARRALWRVEGREVVIGQIPTVSEPFCDRCNRLRLDSRGRLFVCMRDESGHPLAADLLRAGPPGVAARMREIAGSGAQARPRSSWPGRSMAILGG